MKDFKPYALYKQSEFYEALMEKDDPNRDPITRMRRLKRKRAYILYTMRSQIKAIKYYHHEHLRLDYYYEDKGTSVDYWNIDSAKEHLENAFSEAMDDINSQTLIDAQFKIRPVAVSIDLFNYKKKEEK